MAIAGRVKWFNPEKNFGFIVPDVGGVDIFVHISQLTEGIDALSDGQRVQFEEVPSRRKSGSYEAAKVRVI